MQLLNHRYLISLSSYSPYKLHDKAARMPGMGLYGPRKNRFNNLPLTNRTESLVLNAKLYEKEMSQIKYQPLMVIFFL
jgi:hypothetical protein